jgi:hypothetical protein
MEREIKKRFKGEDFWRRKYLLKEGLEKEGQS